MIVNIKSRKDEIEYRELENCHPFIFRDRLFIKVNRESAISLHENRLIYFSVIAKIKKVKIHEAGVEIL